MNTGKIINILASVKPVDMGNILWWVCELEEVCAAEGMLVEAVMLVCCGTNDAIDDWNDNWLVNRHNKLCVFHWYIALQKIITYQVVGKWKLTIWGGLIFWATALINDNWKKEYIFWHQQSL